MKCIYYLFVPVWSTGLRRDGVATATQAGRPFFVMELVRGVPITKYCDDNNLPMQQRLELFI